MKKRSLQASSLPWVFASGPYYLVYFDLDFPTGDMVPLPAPEECTDGGLPSALSKTASITRGPAHRPSRHRTATFQLPCKGQAVINSPALCSSAFFPSRSHYD